MTCRGFGLNVPKLMTTILKTVLEKMDSTENVMDLYMNNIVGDETAVPIQRVREHLGKFVFITKPPESLKGRVTLDIQLLKDMAWKFGIQRGNEIPEREEAQANVSCFQSAKK